MAIMTTTSSLAFQPVLERIAEEIERTPAAAAPPTTSPRSPPATRAASAWPSRSSTARCTAWATGGSRSRRSPSPRCSRWPWTWPARATRCGSTWGASPPATRSTPWCSWSTRTASRATRSSTRAPWSSPTACTPVPATRRRTAGVPALGERQPRARLRPGGGRLGVGARCPQRRPRPFHGVLRQHRQPRAGAAGAVLPPVLRGGLLRRPRPGDHRPGPARHPFRRLAAAQPQPGQADQRDHADLRHVRRGRRLRLPRRAARQERCRGRRHRGGARPLHPVRVEPGLDERGNSVAGVAALDRFTTLTGLSVF